jgi:plasmid stabilization system protein ParE
MPRIIWSPLAKTDLERHYYFLVVKNPIVAEQAMDALEQAVDRLGEMPYIGSILDEKSGLRKWPVLFKKYGYVIHYRVTDAAVVINSIYDGRENRLY